jgi:hypothetical protein
MKNSPLYKGSLNTIIMRLMDENGRMYGYEITQTVKDLTNNNKIMLGGITLTVNPSGKKSDKEGFKVIYPVINRQRGPGGGAYRSVTV